MKDFLRRHRFTVLLGSLVALYVLSPVIEVTGLRREPLIALFALVILSAVNAASERPAYLRIALAMAAPAFALVWTRAFVDDPAVYFAGDVLLIALLCYTIGLVLLRVVRETDVDYDILSGTAAVYLMLGGVWAVSYRMIEIVAPGSFTNISADLQASWAQFLYFSLTTLTTLGYGDITPVNPVARIWTSLEAAAGVFFLAILVARLVSLYRR